MKRASIPVGEDVLGFLGAQGTAWVGGVGALDEVAVASLRHGQEETRHIEGLVTLVSLSGPAEGPVMVTVVFDGEVIAGRLVRGRSAGVELAVEAIASGGDAKAEHAKGASTWAGVAKLSPARGEDDEADELPKFGDQVDHFVFGLCDVMVVRGERMKIKDVGAGGKLREIAVGAFKVKKPSMRDGKRVFQLVKRT